MAQNFRRYTSNDVGTSVATLFTANITTQWLEHLLLM